MFGEVSKLLSAETSEILKNGPQYKLQYSHFLSTHENIIFSTFANYLVSYEVDKAYKVILGLILEVLGQKRHSTEWERQDMCRVKCLHGLIWIETFRDRSLFAWIGNFFRLPQAVVDTPGTWHLLRFIGIIVLWKVMEMWIAGVTDFSVISTNDY